MTSEDSVRTVRFNVFRIWKGFYESEITVETNVESSCQFIPKIGERLMIYANEHTGSDIPFYIHYCSVGTFNDDKMKVTYGEGKLIEQSQVVTPINETTENFFSIVWKKIVSFFS